MSFRRPLQQPQIPKLFSTSNKNHLKICCYSYSSWEFPRFFMGGWTSMAAFLVTRALGLWPIAPLVLLQPCWWGSIQGGAQRASVSMAVESLTHRTCSNDIECLAFALQVFTYGFIFQYETPNLWATQQIFSTSHRLSACVSTNSTDKREEL